MLIKKRVVIVVINHSAERIDKKMKPTKEQFQEYVAIRDSGVTNMFDVRYITSISDTGLTKPICIYIMQNFQELADEYGVAI